MNLEYVKGFLRVDFDSDDEYIDLLMRVASEYVKNAIGKNALDASGNVDDSNPLVRLLMLNIITTLYDARGYTVETANEKAQYTLRSIIKQLQYGGDDND